MKLQEMIEQFIVEGESESEGVIKALRDTDYKDSDAYFKMVQLLKGLAVASAEDEKAAAFLRKLSDALTDVAKKVQGKAEESADDGSGDILEVKKYVYPKTRRDLDEKTPANFKKRAKLFKSAVKHVEVALNDLASMPRLDFYADISDIWRQLHDVYSADGGEVGMKAMVAGYERDAGNPDDAIDPMRKHKIATRKLLDKMKK